MKASIFFPIIVCIIFSCISNNKTDTDLSVSKRISSDTIVKPKSISENAHILTEKDPYVGKKYSWVEFQRVAEDSIIYSVNQYSLKGKLLNRLYLVEENLASFKNVNNYKILNIGYSIHIIINKKRFVFYEVNYLDNLSSDISCKDNYELVASYTQNQSKVNNADEDISNLAPALPVCILVNHLNSNLYEVQIIDSVDKIKKNIYTAIGEKSPKSIHSLRKLFYRKDTGNIYLNKKNVYLTPNG